MNELILYEKMKSNSLRKVSSKNTIMQINYDTFDALDKKENVVVSSESNEESRIVAESNVNNVEKMRGGTYHGANFK